MSKDTDQAVANIQAAVSAGDNSKAEDLVLSLLGETVVYTFIAQHRWPAKCGTVAGYVRHIDEGTVSCQPCRDANTKRDKQARAKAKAKAGRRRQAVAFLGRLLEDTEPADTEKIPALGAKVFWSNQNLPSTVAWDSKTASAFAISEDRSVMVMPDTLQIARVVATGDAMINDYHKVRSSKLVAVTDEPEPETDPFAAV